MHRTFRLLLLAAVTTLCAAGCATTSETSDKKGDQRLVQEAPLGSRIRKKTNTTPVLGASREDVERARAQQGAIATGVFNNPNAVRGGQQR